MGGSDMKRALRALAFIALVSAMAPTSSVSTFAAPERTIDGANHGELLWENRGQAAPQGDVRAIDGEGNVVVATGDVGVSCATPFTCHWFVRAQDARTGATLWEDKP